MIIIILLLALGLRLWNLNQSLWLDEGINVLFAKNLPFLNFIKDYPLGDFHPPLYFGLLWIWGRIFGFSEVSVRIPSLIFGVVTVFLVYKIGQKLFNTQTGILSALLFALAPLPIYYSQEARMYSLALFMVSLNFWLFLKLLDSKKYLLTFGLITALVLYSDYLPYLIFPAQFFYLYLFERKKMTQFLLGCLVGGIFWLPWLLIFPNQFAEGKETAIQIPGWSAIVGGSNIKNLGLVFIKTFIGRISFDNKYLYELVILTLSMVYGFIFIKVLKDKTREIYLLIFWFVIPLFLALVISFKVPILSYFRMIFILPSFYILVAFGLSRLENDLRQIFTTFLILSSFVFITIFNLNPQFQREDWRGLSNYLEINTNQNSAVLFEDKNLPPPFQYYYRGGFEAFGALNKLPAQKMTDLKSLNNLTSKDKIFLINYLVEIYDPNQVVNKKLINLGFKISSVKNFNGVGFVYEYTY